FPLPPSGNVNDFRYIFTYDNVVREYRYDHYLSPDEAKNRA
ncbi:MAG: hypothetical protein ACJAUL_002916, partial [Paraglaciecola sp.]